MASKTYEADKNKFFFSPLNNSTTTDIYKAFQLKLPMQYTGANASLFQLTSDKALPIPVVPDYLYFECKQLAPQNCVSQNASLYSIISKALNTSKGDQTFTISTTEPLYKLTLQNIVNTQFTIRVYNEQFVDYTKIFDNMKLIIVALKPPYDVYFSDRRRSL